MFDNHYTVLFFEARRKYHIKHVLIYIVCLHIFETFYFYQSSVCEDKCILHFNKSTKGLVQAMLHVAFLIFITSHVLD